MNTPPAEFVEVALKATEDPADYTLSFYQPDGTLQTNIRLNAAVNGEISLTDATSVNPDPDNPDYLIYRIASDGRYLFTGDNTTTDEARAVALTNTTTGTLIDAYAVGSDDVTFVEGVASGNTATASGLVGGGQSLQWDIYGNQYAASRTPGDAILCFSADTLIQTLVGPKSAGDLRVGDLVRTQDHGYKPIQWIHSDKIPVSLQRSSPKIRPVRIASNSLAPGYPSADLIVSPQHRIMVRSKICERMYKNPEVLVKAKALVGLEGIAIQPPEKGLIYVHFLLDGHEIVFANGHPCESLLPGEMTFETLNGSDKLRLQQCVAQQKSHQEETPAPARPIAEGSRAKEMIMRHRKNGKSMFELSPSVRPDRQRHMA